MALRPVAPSTLQDLIQKVVRAKTEKALKAQAEVLAALQSELTASIAEVSAQGSSGWNPTNTFTGQLSSCGLPLGRQNIALR